MNKRVGDKMYIKIRDNILKYQLTVYFVITFLLSWTIWGILYSSSKGLLSYSIYQSRMRIFDNSLSTFTFLGGSMPSFVALFISYITGGKNEAKELIKRLAKWRVKPLWYLFVLLFSFIFYYLPYLISNLFGASYELYLREPFYLIPVHFLIALVFWGPLGEELGWRGYALPRLQSRYGPQLSSMILGVIWGVWHLPLFFIGGSSQIGSNFGLYTVSVIIYSLIYTWVFNRTKGSVLISCLLHTSFNYTGALIAVRPIADSNTAYLVVSNMMFISFLIFVILELKKQRGGSNELKVSP